MTNRSHQKHVRPLLSVLPELVKKSCFALHGGTAINLFARDIAHKNLEGFREGLRNRIAQALTGNQNDNSGISISTPELGADGKYTVTATLTGNAFHQMNIIERDAEKAANQPSR